MNIPPSPHTAERAKHLSQLRELVRTVLNDDDLLERFQQEWEARIPLRPRVRLPFAPIEQLAQTITLDSHVRLATTWRLVFDAATEGGKVGFAAGTVTGECDSELVPALKKLRGAATCSVRELCAHIPSEDSARKLRTLLALLALQGTIVTERSPVPDDVGNARVEL